MQIDKLQYLFDPLCGWCYASAPALKYLAKTYPEKLELLPSGLFSEEGARTINAQWATHAWTNDRRIASLTGQCFSEAYHKLLHSNSRFDSQYLNRVLTVFRDIAPAAEAGLLHELQISRYVLGLDTSRSDVVAQISIEYAMTLKLDIPNYLISDQLAVDTNLSEMTNKRIQNVKALMRSLGVNGVPLLLVISGGKTHAISGHSLYGGTMAISNALKQFS
ncbi:protein-disulfide isomerase [Dickeya dadantii]|uniref:DsbA family protein n=1 Tax=Dickeya dadantii TaxID=204038 RepID=UPI0013727C03|nr:protein-disulfide isomerase [Dickeya dadantii]NAT78332.1 protein-disulfide isomerase [Dickeya dadantii]NPE61689.1 protein-disulfide isomerase [Dickeya dadantii]